MVWWTLCPGAFSAAAAKAIVLNPRSAWTMKNERVQEDAGCPRQDITKIEELAESISFLDHARAWLNKVPRPDKVKLETLT